MEQWFRSGGSLPKAAQIAIAMASSPFLGRDRSIITGCQPRWGALRCRVDHQAADLSGGERRLHMPEHIKKKLSEEIQTLERELPDLQNRQIGILRSAMGRVAPGGRLIYSTCSLEPEENEAVVEAALSADGSFRAVECRERLAELQSSGELVWRNIDSLTSGPYLRTIPGVHPCDGFFAAILEKI